MDAELAAKRLGRLTASSAAVYMGSLKTDGLAKLIRRAAGERVYGDLGEESYQSADMRRGQLLEHEALDQFEFEEATVLERQAFRVHRSMDFVSATPDAIWIPDDGRPRVIECKSPTFHVWCECVERNEIPSEYRWQTRWECWTTDISEGLFLAYHPKGGLHRIPFGVDEDEANQMRERALYIEAKIRSTVKLLRARQ